MKVTTQYKVNNMSMFTVLDKLSMSSKALDKANKEVKQYMTQVLLELQKIPKTNWMFNKNESILIDWPPRNDLHIFTTEGFMVPCLKLSVCPRKGESVKHLYNRFISEIEMHEFTNQVESLFGPCDRTREGEWYLKLSDCELYINWHLGDWEVLLRYDEDYDFESTGECLKTAFKNAREEFLAFKNKKINSLNQTNHMLDTILEKG